MTTFFIGTVRCVETEFLDDAFKNRVQSARPDVLSRAIHLKCVVGHRLDRVGGELEVEPLGFHQRFVLPG